MLRQLPRRTAARYFRGYSTTQPNSAQEDQADTSPEQTDKSPESLANETIKQQTEKITALTSTYRTTLADMENLRKRTAQELVTAKDYAVQKFAREIIENVDVLKMAVDATPQEKSKELQDLFVGVEMTRAEILKTLGRFGVTSYDPIGKAFDANTMNAVFMTEKGEPGTVSQVLKEGYMIKDRVLRSAQVGVVKP